MPVVEILGPLILLIALGAGLARLRFMGREFMNDLNKLAFWIALPALLFTSSANAVEPGSQIWRLLGVMLGATLLISLLAWLAAFPLRLPGHARGTLVQAAFRGNLAYIGIPVLAVTLGSDAQAMATAVVVMVLVMASYNVLAVIVLQASNPELSGGGWGRVTLSIFRNPLLIAGLLGLLVPLLGIKLPSVLDRTLQSLGAAAVPIALLCIGGSLATSSLHGRRSWIVAAAVLKVAILPFLVYWLARMAGLGHAERLIALVLAACPTAAASFVMAKQMGGDEELASGSIALSTLLSGASLWAVLVFAQ